MKNYKTIFLLIFAGVSIMAACKKNKTGIDAELDKLPPITQTGANTFGCLVNGKAFIPDNGCRFLCSPAFKATYDNSNGGLFTINATLSKNQTDQSINLGIDTLNKIGKYIFLNNNINRRVAFNDYKIINNCTTLFSSQSDVVVNGYLNITKFELINGIISGTFNFTLSKNGCESIYISNGMFDAKL